MSPELQSIIKQYNALPEAVQQTIFYGEVGKIIGEIGRAFGLNAQKTVALENEVTLILLFLVPRETFEETLRTSFGMTPADATTVAFLIDNAILVPTFKRLERAFSAPAAAATITSPTPTPAPAPATDSEPVPESSSLPEVRTMATDQKQLGYQSETIDTPSYTGLSQDELRKRS